MSGKVVFFLTQDQADALLSIAEGHGDRSPRRARYSLYGKGLLTERWSDGKLTPLGKAAVELVRRLAGPGRSK